MTVLVMGATGNVGGAIVDALGKRGTAAREVSRREHSWPSGVEEFVADPNDPEGLAPAAVAIDGVFLMSGYAAEAALLDALSEAHVVLLSSSSAPLGTSGNAVAAYHLKSEQAVQASGLPWTVLRPSSFQSNVLRWRDQLRAGDVVRAPFGETPTAMIDPADIAEVAAAALTQPGHAGHTYRLSGPESLTPPDQVTRLAAALDRPLTFEAIPDDEARRQLPPEYAEATFDIFRDHPELESEVQPTVEQLLGRPPGRLEDWLIRHRDEF
jgi:uncharacterized protein YbjT (DUF2867 family)